MKDVRSEDDINACQMAAAKEQKLELDDLASAIRSRFTGEQLGRFDEAQTHWYQMTLMDCEIESNFYEGAKAYLAVQSECLRRHYQERMSTLRKYLCPELQLGSGC